MNELTQFHKIESTIEPKDTTGWKKGVRVLGVAESFRKSDVHSIVVGVVMRGDHQIDGFGICQPHVGGTDATEQIISMYNRINRKDIRVCILNGSIISWFNVIDITEIVDETGIPVICVSYDSSEGLEQYVKEYFPDDWKSRMKTIEKNGIRYEFVLKTGFSIYMNCSGITQTKASRLLDLFTIAGRIPEPIRVAKLLAYSIHRDIITR